MGGGGQGAHAIVDFAPPAPRQIKHRLASPSRHPTPSNIFSLPLPQRKQSERVEQTQRDMSRLKREVKEAEQRQGKAEQAERERTAQLESSKAELAQKEAEGKRLAQQV